MESILKKRMWISLLLVVLAFIAVLWVFRSYVGQPSVARFSLVSLKDNTLLISDADVLSYNWTSQEIPLGKVAAVENDSDFIGSC